MSKEFLQPPISLNPRQIPESPYLRAREEWDRRLGSARAQAFNWRMAFFGVLVVLMISTAGNFYQAARNTVMPVVVEVGRETGETRVIGKVGALNYTPQFAQIQYFLRQFVRDIREIPADPIVIKQRWLNAYFFLRKEAAALLDQRANEKDSPISKIGEIRLSVQPLTVNAIGANNSFQVRWKESVFDLQGRQINEYTMSGLFTVEFAQPDTEEAISHNPLGIYIRSFSWSREI